MRAVGNLVGLLINIILRELDFDNRTLLSVEVYIQRKQFVMDLIIMAEGVVSRLIIVHIIILAPGAFALETNCPGVEKTQLNNLSVNGGQRLRNLLFTPLLVN